MAKTKQKPAATKEALEAASVSVNQAPAKVEIPTETFEADGVEYKFIAPLFNLDGKTIKAMDAIKDEVILAKLVQLKAGVIAPVE